MKEKESNLARGLEDTLARVINRTTGIEPCSSCDKRKDTLNKWFPYTDKLVVKNSTITKLTDEILEKTMKDIKERFNV